MILLEKSLLHDALLMKLLLKTLLGTVYKQNNTSILFPITFIAMHQKKSKTKIASTIRLTSDDFEIVGFLYSTVGNGAALLVALLRYMQRNG
jgi:hypothetical protein